MVDLDYDPGTLLAPCPPERLRKFDIANPEGWLAPEPPPPPDEVPPQALDYLQKAGVPPDLLAEAVRAAKADQQREQAQAIALFLTGLPFTSILGAPLSGFILDHVHWLGIPSWRWLLTLEAIPAILCGVLTYLLLPARPHDAKFLTAAEKTWLSDELAREGREKQNAHQISAVVVDGSASNSFLLTVR